MNKTKAGFTPLEIKKKCYRLFQHFRSKKRECSNIASSLRSDVSELSPPCRREAGLTGFTLLEVLTVVAIIGLLAAMIFPNLGKVRIRARKSKAISELNTIKLALIEYYSEYSAFPTNIGGSGGLYKLFEEDYLDTALADAFKSSQPYRYYDCSDGTIDTADSCIVFSVGANGIDTNNPLIPDFLDFNEALNDAYPGIPNLDEPPTSDNIYLFMTNASRNDPLAIREGEIRYKE